MDTNTNTNRDAYTRGWRSSQRYTGRSSVSPLERADDRNEPREWYLGYHDHAAGRPKWSSLEESQEEPQEVATELKNEITELAMGIGWESLPQGLRDAVLALTDPESPRSLATCPTSSVIQWGARVRVLLRDRLEEVWGADHYLLRAPGTDAGAIREESYRRARRDLPVHWTSERLVMGNDGSILADDGGGEYVQLYPQGINYDAYMAGHAQPYDVINTWDYSKGARYMTDLEILQEVALAHDLLGVDAMVSHLLESSGVEGADQYHELISSIVRQEGMTSWEEIGAIELRSIVSDDLGRAGSLANFLHRQMEEDNDHPLLGEFTPEELEGATAEARSAYHDRLEEIATDMEGEPYYVVELLHGDVQVLADQPF